MISIIGLILVTRLVFTQTSATLVSVTPTQSAVVGQRAFHVKLMAVCPASSLVN
jgi:hypothetical protein